MVEKKLEGIDNAIGDNVGVCHGDFHMNNILLGEDEKIWLIDFAKRDLPHFWKDIRKLFQYYTSRCTLLHGEQIPTRNKEIFQEEIFQ